MVALGMVVLGLVVLGLVQVPNEFIESINLNIAEYLVTDTFPLACSRNTGKLDIKL
jgi:hypothetical protein